MRAWEPEPGESAKAFSAFKIYRDLGPSRSLDRAYEVYSGRQLGGKRAARRFQQWSSQHDWVERARAHDAYLELIRREAIERHEREQATAMAERQARIREKRLAYAERIADQILRMVDWPLTRKNVTEAHPDGKEKTVELHPVRWSKTTIAHLDAVVASVLTDASADGATPEFEKLMEILADEEDGEPHDS